MATSVHNVEEIQPFVELEAHRKLCLIYGYIREIQDVFLDNRTYHHITEDIQRICASYIYWYRHQPTLYSGIEDNNDSNYSFLHPHIITQNYVLIERHQQQYIDEIKQILMNRFVILTQKGFLSPHFVEKMLNNDSEIVRFLRQNRTAVHKELTKRFKLRPSIPQLQQRNIIPYGAYIYKASCLNDIDIDSISDTPDSIQMHIEQHPFKMVETILELENYTRSSQRPSIRVLLKKGIITMNDVMHYFHVDMHEFYNTIRRELKYSELLQNIIGCNAKNTISYANDIDVYTNKDELFETIRCTLHDALRQSCDNTRYEEADVLQQMEVMNEEMKNLRSNLDKYFLSDQPDVDQFQTDEENIRISFRGIQEKLMKISTKQNAIQNKLKILHKIENNLPLMEQSFNDDWAQLCEYKHVVSRDLSQLLNLESNVLNRLPISELKSLKQNIEDKISSLRINGLQSIFSEHRDIAIADSYSGVQNVMSHYGACFVLLIWLGTQFPNELLHAIASFVAHKKVVL